MEPTKKKLKHIETGNKILLGIDFREILEITRHQNNTTTIVVSINGMKHRINYGNDQEFLTIDWL